MVNAYSQLLVRRIGSVSHEEAQKDVDFIGSGVRWMERLIQDLLSYARTVHTETTRGESVRLTDALNQALESLTVQMEEKRASVEAGPLPAVLGERTQLTQLFQNLLSNALKYSRPDVPPCIRIEARRDGAEWIVVVRDNGIGFKQEYAKHIFGLFKRLHHGEYAGTGLGLAICSGLSNISAGAFGWKASREKGRLSSSLCGQRNEGAAVMRIKALCYTVLSSSALSSRLRISRLRVAVAVPIIFRTFLLCPR
jgi:light-regulated signal transduction histidine kinase (bacteriophytochrome)